MAGGWELPYSYLSPLKLGLGLSLAITRNLERQIGSNAEYGKIQVLINVCQKPKLASIHPQLQLDLIRTNMTTAYPAGYSIHQYVIMNFHPSLGHDGTLLVPFLPGSTDISLA